MPHKSKRQGRQTTRWESDDCVVPLQPGIQSGEVKPGGHRPPVGRGAGKAVRPARGASVPPSALRGSFAVPISRVAALRGVEIIPVHWCEMSVSLLLFGVHLRCLRMSRGSVVPGAGGEPDALTAHVRF